MGRAEAHIYIVGSVGAGKTTLARKLYEECRSRACVCVVSINVCHMLCYVVLRFAYLLVQLLYRQTRLVGNYYLTLYFTYKRFFSKIIGLMMILDIASIPVAALLARLKCKLNCRDSSKIVMIYDEYLLNSIVDYFYFAMKTEWRRVYRLLYTILYKLLLNELLRVDGRKAVVYMEIPLEASISAWMKREETFFVDVGHLAVRTAATRAMLRALEQAAKPYGVNVVHVKARDAGEAVNKAYTRLMSPPPRAAQAAG